MWVPILGLTALAGALRFLNLGNTPPGLYRDEAFNGLDALRVLDGDFAVYFAANHGREPLFLYLIAATVGALGRTPGALRLAAAVCGTLTVPVTYLMVRAWFNRRVALLSAAIISVIVWHIQLSRVGFRAVTLPLAIAVFFWSGARAFHSRRLDAWLLTGILYGLMFYTYVAARFTPVAVLGLAAYLLCVGKSDRLWPDALYFGSGALIALIPLGVYAAHHWDVVMGRPGQVSVLNPAVNQGDLWGTVGRHLIRTLGLFFVRGDSIPRHNVPGRPVFTPLMGAAMVLGSARAAAQARRRDVGSALVLIWVGTMLVPTLAAADAPHFLRAVGVLPPLVVLPALGLEMVWRASAQQSRRIWGSALLCLVLAFSLGATVRDYFVQYGTSPDASYAFEAAATELAAEVNRFTGIGWDGKGVLGPTAASKDKGSEERRVYLDMRLWRAWEGLAFLVPDQQALVRFQPNGTLPPAATDQILLLLWPYDDLRPYVAALPHPAQIEARAGPLTRGDLEKTPYPAYASYRVGPRKEQHVAPLARFGESIELADLDVETEGHTWQVRLLWSTQDSVDEDYTAFVAVCDDRCTGDRLMAQDDAEPGAGYYPTSLWHPGDVIVDVRTLELSPRELAAPRIAVGLYAWPALERLPVTMPSGAPSADMLILPLGNGGGDAD
jgi:hypothetical protein